MKKRFLRFAGILLLGAIGSTSVGCWGWRRHEEPRGHYEERREERHEDRREEHHEEHR